VKERERSRERERDRERKREKRERKRIKESARTIVSESKIVRERAGHCK